MTEPERSRSGDGELDELRAELARFVLREAGQAVAADPSLPLSAAFTRAIHEEAERAARLAREGNPTAEELARQVVSTVRPELVEIVRRAADGDVRRLERRGVRAWIASLSDGLVVALAILALLLAFAGGFGAAWLLAQRPVSPGSPPAAPSESARLPEASPGVQDGGGAAASEPSSPSASPVPEVPAS